MSEYQNSKKHQQNSRMAKQHFEHKLKNYCLLIKIQQTDDSRIAEC